MVYNKGMQSRVLPSFLTFFRKPEVQFIAVAFLPFLGFFLFFYGISGSQDKEKVLIVFAGVAALMLLQAAHALHLRKLLIKKERAFLGVCAHQMRTPLTATRWAVEEVLREGGASSKNEKIKSGLDVSFDRMNNLLDTLSQFAGLEEGQYEKNPVRMDICEEIERAVEEAEPIGMQYGVSVAAEGPCEELWVKIDPVQVDMLLSNLINNGIKYNRRGGTVTVSARPISGGREIEVQVRDSGVGIPAHEQGRIFERLFRGEQATKLNTEGYGLGLYLVKEIVVDHGGRVWVESTPGKGSVFHFALPVGR